MNVLLWILQILLALHTGMGAIWKFSNPAQSVPSLAMIPQGLWLMLSVFELLCTVGFLLPAMKKRWVALAPLAAAGITGEMIVFAALHFRSGETDNGPMIYWLIVAALSLVIAVGRVVQRSQANKLAAV